jgi:hypothetical protein
VEQDGRDLHLAGDVRSLHAAAELIGADGRGGLSASGDLVGHQKVRSALGGVARTCPSASIAKDRNGGGGRLDFAVGHLGETHDCLTHGLTSGHLVLLVIAGDGSMGPTRLNHVGRRAARLCAR